MPDDLASGDNGGVVTDHGPDGEGVFIRHIGRAFHCRCGKADFVAGYPCPAMKPGDTWGAR